MYTMTINPHDHVDIAKEMAGWAAKRYRGHDAGEWLGVAYEGLHDAASKFVSSEGGTFGGYARSIIKFRFIDHIRELTGTVTRKKEDSAVPGRERYQPACMQPIAIDGLDMVDGERRSSAEDLETLKAMPAPYVDTIRLLLMGNTHRVTGRTLGVTRAAIDYRKRQLLHFIGQGNRIQLEGSAIKEAGVPERESGGPGRPRTWTDARIMDVLRRNLERPGDEKQASLMFPYGKLATRAIQLAASSTEFEAFRKRVGGSGRPTHVIRRLDSAGKSAA